MNNKPKKIIYKNQEKIHDKIFDFVRSKLPKSVTEAYLFGSVVERKFGEYIKGCGIHKSSDIDVIVFIPKDKIPKEWKYLNTEKKWWRLYRGGKIEINNTPHTLDLLIVKEGMEDYARQRIKEKRWNIEYIKEL